jgi:hypothetical protein
MIGGARECATGASFSRGIRMSREIPVKAAALLLAAGTAIAMMALPAKADPVYAYTTIDDGTNGTFPGGINNVGTVSGFYLDSGGAGHGFVYSGGGFSTLDNPSGVTNT